MRIRLSELKQIITHEIHGYINENRRDPAVNFVNAMTEVSVALSRLREAERIMIDVTDRRFQNAKSQIAQAYEILSSIKR